MLSLKQRKADLEKLPDIELSQFVRDLDSAQRNTKLLESQVSVYQQRIDNMKTQIRQMAKLLQDKDDLVGRYLVEIERLRGKPLEHRLLPGSPLASGSAGPTAIDEDQIADEISLPTVNTSFETPSKQQDMLVSPSFEIFKATQDELTEARQEIARLVSEKAELVEENIQLRQGIAPKEQTPQVSDTTAQDAKIQELEEQLSHAKKLHNNKEILLLSAQKELQHLKQALKEKDGEIASARRVSDFLCKKDSGTDLTEFLLSNPEFSNVMKEYELKLQQQESSMGQLQDIHQRYLNKYKGHLNDLQSQYDLIRQIRRGLDDPCVSEGSLKNVIGKRCADLEEKSR